MQLPDSAIIDLLKIESIILVSAIKNGKEISGSEADAQSAQLKCNESAKAFSNSKAHELQCLPLSNDEALYTAYTGVLKACSSFKTSVITGGVKGSYSSFQIMCMLSAFSKPAGGDGSAIIKTILI